MPVLVNSVHFRINKGESFYYPLHYHGNSCEFLLIIEGEGSFQVDGRKYTAKGGNLMCYNRSIWHEERSTSEIFEAMFIEFKGLKMTNLPIDHFLESNHPALIDLGEHFISIKHQFGEILAEHKNTAPESVIITNQLLGVLMCRLSQHVHYGINFKHVKKPSVVGVEQGKRYIELNYKSEINLEELAKLTHINYYHFCHLFKKNVGISPIRYLISYRMEVAKHYLSTTDLSIVEISELVGYKSDTYFQNIFKKMIGVPPGKFRSEVHHQNRNDS